MRNNNHLLISVIITNYNYSNLLLQCINSVLKSNLDYKEFEIIVIDDASTDNSSAIIESCMTVNPNVAFRFIKNETNIGLVRSRNKGIFYAKGRYVFILDADNYIEPDCLKAHAKCMLQNKDAIACYGKIQDFSNENGAYLGLRSSRTFDYISLLKGPYIDAMAMFDRQMLIDVGVYNLKMPNFGWEDYELWLRIGKEGKKVIFMENLPPLSFYRIHDNNMTAKVADDIHNQIIYFLKTLYPLETKFKDSTIFNSLQSERIDHAQVFYHTDQNEISEDHSIILIPQKNRISAKLPGNLNYKGFRIDPLNDVAIIQVDSVRFYIKENEVFFKVTLTSNARIKKDDLYFFDTEDPQITINFPQNEYVEIDEICIQYKIIEKGSEALKYIIRSLLPIDNKKTGTTKLVSKIKSLFVTNGFHWFSSLWALVHISQFSL